MRAALLLAPGQIELREVPTPRPGPGEVVLRIERALAGGTDRKAFQRGHPYIPMPGPFGHRYSGVVAAVGEGGPDLAVGQPVMGVHSAPCLSCSLCRRQKWNLCPEVMQTKVLGAFAEYLRIPARVAAQNLFPRPRQVSAEEAALLEPAACVVHGLEQIAWQHAERVVVVGLGAIGLLFAQLLPRYTAASRAGVGRRDKGLALARSYGVDPLWDARRCGPPPGEWHRRFDVVLECTGRLEGWQQAFDLAAPGGQVLLFGGLPAGSVFPVDATRLHYEEIRLIGDFHFSPGDVAKARQFLLEGAVASAGLIDGCLPLERLPEALQNLAAGQALQYAIAPG